MIKERVGRKEPISYRALVEPIRAVIRDTPDARLLQENGGRFKVCVKWVHTLRARMGLVNEASGKAYTMHVRLAPGSSSLVVPVRDSTPAAPGSGPATTATASAAASHVPGGGRALAAAAASTSTAKRVTRASTRGKAYTDKHVTRAPAAALVVPAVTASFVHGADPAPAAPGDCPAPAPVAAPGSRPATASAAACHVLGGGRAPAAAAASTYPAKRVTRAPAATAPGACPAPAAAAAPSAPGAGPVDVYTARDTLLLEAAQLALEDMSQYDVQIAPGVPGLVDVAAADVAAASAEHGWRLCDDVLDKVS